MPQSVAQRYSNLHASKGALWWARLMAVRSPRMPVPLLLAATDRAVGLIDRFAGCFTDRRSPELVEHTVATLV